MDRKMEAEMKRAFEHATPEQMEWLRKEQSHIEGRGPEERCLTEQAQKRIIENVLVNIKQEENAETPAKSGSYMTAFWKGATAAACVCLLIGAGTLTILYGRNAGGNVSPAATTGNTEQTECTQEIIAQESISAQQEETAASEHTKPSETLSEAENTTEEPQDDKTKNPQVQEAYEAFLPLAQEADEKIANMQDMASGLEWVCYMGSIYAGGIYERQNPLAPYIGKCIGDALGVKINDYMVFSYTIEGVYEDEVPVEMHYGTCSTTFGSEKQSLYFYAKVTEYDETSETAVCDFEKGFFELYDPNTGVSTFFAGPKVVSWDMVDVNAMHLLQEYGARLSEATVRCETGTEEQLYYLNEVDWKNSYVYSAFPFDDKLFEETQQKYASYTAVWDDTHYMTVVLVDYKRVQLIRLVDGEQSYDLQINTGYYKAAQSIDEKIYGEPSAAGSETGQTVENK